VQGTAAVSAACAASLTNTKRIESNGLDRTRHDQVKGWQDGKMIKPWRPAGMLNEERSVRGTKGHHQMRLLVAGLGGPHVARFWQMLHHYVP
jgi:hypothetical protein